MSVTGFGTLPDGREVQEIRLDSGGLSVAILTRGAAIRDLAFDAGKGLQRRVLGFNSLADSLKQSPYFGAVAGRYANRIAGGRFKLEGLAYQLSLNEKGRTHLHGGTEGFSHHVWSLVDHGAEHVTLELVSPAGDQGYPGTLTARCTYRIAGDGLLEIRLGAATDAPTIMNLATHSYFNLDGTADILDHLLEIPAAHYLPVDAQLIPTGEIAPVAETPFDFRISRPVRGTVTYDHNMVIDRARTTTPRLMARLLGPLSRTQLEVHSTEPGLQFYDGSGLNASLPGHDGRLYGCHGGLCLEPQIFPDSPNHPGFTDATLRPGADYAQVTQYRFSRF